MCCGFNIDALGPSVFNVSTSNYANTTVILKGLHTNLLYDCTAAAVGTAAANCTSPIVGSTKLLFKVGIQVPETATHSTIRTGSCTQPHVMNIPMFWPLDCLNKSFSALHVYWKPLTLSTYFIFIQTLRFHHWILRLFQGHCWSYHFSCHWLHYSEFIMNLSA